MYRLGIIRCVRKQDNRSRVIARAEISRVDDDKLPCMNCVCRDWRESRMSYLLFPSFCVVDQDALTTGVQDLSLVNEVQQPIYVALCGAKLQ